MLIGTLHDIHNSHNQAVTFGILKNYQEIKHLELQLHVDVSYWTFNCIVHKVKNKSF